MKAETILHAGTKGTAIDTSKTELEAAGIAHCANCNLPIIAIFQLTYAAYVVYRTAAYSGSWRQAKVPSITAIRTIPEYQASAPLEYLPDRIGRLLHEAKMDAADPERLPAGVIAKCRSVLELAAKELQAEGRNLRDKIESLHTNGLITTPMRDWANKVRLDGNVAVHEIEGTHEDALALLGFVEIFVEVVFDLPQRIRDRMEKAET